jgi:hypothetical protein
MGQRVEKAPRPLGQLQTSEPMPRIEHVSAVHCSMLCTQMGSDMAIQEFFNTLRKLAAPLGREKPGPITVAGGSYLDPCGRSIKRKVPPNGGENGRYGNRGAAAGGSENMPDLPQ